MIDENWVDVLSSGAERGVLLVGKKTELDRLKLVVNRGIVSMSLGRLLICETGGSRAATDEATGLEVEGVVAGFVAFHVTSGSEWTTAGPYPSTSSVVVAAARARRGYQLSHRALRKY